MVFAILVNIVEKPNHRRYSTGPPFRYRVVHICYVGILYIHLHDLSVNTRHLWNSHLLRDIHSHTRLCIGSPKERSITILLVPSILYVHAIWILCSTFFIFESIQYREYNTACSRCARVQNDSRKRKLGRGPLVESWARCCLKYREGRRQTVATW